MSNYKLIEKNEVTRDYGFAGLQLIVENKATGKQTLLTDAYGGENTLSGGRVRWSHGTAIEIKKTDTFETLNAEDETGTTVLTRALAGYDEERPIAQWDGFAIRSVANSLGLDNN
jgi:hypothetical protein